MDEFNPYEKPDAEIGGRFRPDLSVARGFRIVILGAIGFGAAGALIGYLIGVAAPEYYRTVFARGQEPGFDPVQVGTGLGLTQGIICGIIVGLVVIMAVALSGRRRVES